VSRPFAALTRLARIRVPTRLATPARDSAAARVRVEGGLARDGQWRRQRLGLAGVGATDPATLQVWLSADHMSSRRHNAGSTGATPSAPVSRAFDRRAFAASSLISFGRKVDFRSTDMLFHLDAHRTPDRHASSTRNPSRP